jgi:amino acid transporter
MIEFLYILIAIAKGLALWLVPLAVAAYVVTYFVMVIIFVIVWKQEQDPRISPFWKTIGRRGPRAR